MIDLNNLNTKAFIEQNHISKIMHTELSKAKQTIEELVQEIANLQSELESTRQELSKAYEAARSYNNSKIDSFIDVAKDLESLSNQCQ